MSAHIEWIAATARGVAARTPVGEHDTEQPAVVIGGPDNMAIVQGTTESLRAFAENVTEAVEQAIRTAEQRINAAVAKAEQAFWQVVADEFPSAKTGDFPPDATFAWQGAARLAVERWTSFNVPEMMDDDPNEQPTNTELVAQHDAFVADALDVDDTPARVGITHWPTTDAERAAFARWQTEVAQGGTALGFRAWAESPVPD